MIVESVYKQVSDTIAALEANAAFDQHEEGPRARRDRIQEITQEAESHLRSIFYPEEEEIDWSNPFFAASKRGTDLLKYEYEASLERERELLAAQQR